MAGSVQLSMKKVSARRSIRHRAAAVLLAAGLTLPGAVAHACGPFLSRAVFTFGLHPDMPLPPFAAGRLGVLQPGYARSYLVVGYRYLTGVPLDAAEQKAALALWSSRLNPLQAAPAEDSAATDAWRESRQQVGDAPPAGDLAVFREVPGATYYLVFANCLPDAYRTAAATLSERAGRQGPRNPRTRDWLTAQDTVFDNCGSEGAVPEPLAAAAAADAGARADRAYQIAAAQFYSQKFDAALASFRQIAADTTSPWRTLAPYLMARTLVRKGTLGAPEGEVDRKALVEAERQIGVVLADAAQAALHPAALRLRDFVRFRSAPSERRAELAQALAKPGQGAALQQQLADYTLLLDRLTGEAAGPQQREPQPRDGTEALTRWLLMFQSDREDAAAEAVAAWRAERTPPWLVAALAKVPPRDSAVPELLEASAKVDPQSPAWPTVGYHAARLLAGRDERDAARARLDALLAAPERSLPAGSVNLLLALRLPLAGSLDAFARDLPRRPVATAYDFAEMPEDVEGDPVTQGRAEPLPLMLDPEGAQIVDASLPLALRGPLVERTSAAPGVARELAASGWVRAVLSRDEKLAETLAPIAAGLDAELAAALADWRAASADDRYYAALLILLRSPGLSPFVREGLPRSAKLGEIDEFRDNWWCRAGDAEDDEVEAGPPPALGFLAADERRVAEAQWQALSALAVAPNHLAAETLAWAQARPDDPRLAEALHLVVRATRFGCTDEETSNFSKRAFQLLHRRFPQSPWAAKTKYHF